MLGGAYKDAVLELMGHVDSFIPTPKRETEKDFVMPVCGGDRLARRPARAPPRAACALRLEQSGLRTHTCEQTKHV